MFRYRAIKKRCFSENFWYLFQPKDCPALLWDDAFFLAGKPFSPVMLYDTIVRGLPDYDLFEGDYVYDSSDGSLLGIAVYHNGFFVQKIGSSVKKPIPFKHIYVRKGDVESVSTLRKFKRTPISFKYLDVIFEFDDFVSVEGLTLYTIVSGKCCMVNLSGVKELLYYDETTGIRGYDGDVFDGHFLDINTVSSVSIDKTIY